MTSPPARPRLRLRQVALVAADLERAERELVAALDVECCFRDPAVATFGLRNALFPVGETLLEVVSPTRDGTTAGRFLERRGGDGGYMVILQTDEELDAVRARLAASGTRVVFEAATEGITGLHLHPRDVGGAIVSIDRADRWDDWPWAGPSWREHRRTATVTAIVGVDVAAVDPAAMCRRWAEVVGREPAADGASIELDEGVIRFVPVDPELGRGEGVAAIDVAAAPGVGLRRRHLVGCDVRIR